MYKVIKSQRPIARIRLVGGNLSQPTSPPPQEGEDPQRANDLSYQKGFAEGKREGLRLGRKEVAPLISQLKNTSQAILQTREETLNRTQKEVVEMALAIAKRVVRANVQVNKEIVTNMVKEALRRTVDRERILIRINPQHVEEIKTHRNEYTSSVEGIENLEIIGDRRVSPGGCVVETNTGNIVADLDAQLEEIRGKLIGS